MKFILGLAVRESADSKDETTLVMREFDWPVIPRIGETLLVRGGGLNHGFEVSEVRFGFEGGLPEIEVWARPAQSFNGKSAEFAERLLANGWMY